MDTKTLIKAMSGEYPAPTRDVDYAALTPAFNKALRMAGCTTVNRVAMFVSQVGPESGMLRWMEELADGSDYDRYENPRGPWRQLGNTEPGDGRRFKGRGPIQLTGRGNYTRFSAWVYDNQESLGVEVPSRDYFIRHPEMARAEKYQLGFLATVWYWTVARNMNGYADRGDINGASTAVNGANPANNLRGRRAMWFHALDIGSALLPDGEEVDPLEEIMKFYKSRAEFEAAMHKIMQISIREVLHGDTDDDGKTDAKPSSVASLVRDEVGDALDKRGFKVKS